MPKRTRIAAAIMSILLAVTCLSFATPSIAEAETDTEKLQSEVERTAQEYDDAQAKVDDLNTKIADNEARIAELEEQIPAKKESAAAAISSHYKLQQESPNLLTMLISSEDFNEFVTTMSYLDIISSKSTDEVDELVAMEQELEDTKAELEKEKTQAEDELAKAQEALTAAQEARAQAQAAAEAQAAKEAAEASAAVSSSQNGGTFTTESGNTSNTMGASSGSPSSIDWSTDKAAFVAQWGPRIDSFLSGSPLAGHGNTFAEAAWDYGVDPRWSPAISAVESSRGQYCFRSHNAWGWGNSSWGDWDTAIRAHVAGLSSGYGYTLSVGAAQKYCPPTWQNWYSSCLYYMECI